MNDSQSIPRIIHYCWFGKTEKPDLIKNCINSWKETLVGYEIIEWNETNFDINCNSFVKDAYRAKKYAFVSDYVRLYALYHYGGIYLDTDVEVLKSLDKFLIHDSFWGYEEKNRIATSTFGAKKSNEVIKLFFNEYTNRKFILEDGKINTITNVDIITDILRKNGLKLDGSYEKIGNDGVIYPQEYFSPYDYINCYSKETENTYTIHHYYKSWIPLKSRIKVGLKKGIARLIGGRNIEKARRIICKNKSSII